MEKDNRRKRGQTHEFAQVWFRLKEEAAFHHFGMVYKVYLDIKSRFLKTSLNKHLLSIYNFADIVQGLWDTNKEIKNMT